MPNDEVSTCVDAKPNATDLTDESLSSSSTPVIADKSCIASVSDKETEGSVGGYSSITENGQDECSLATSVPDDDDRSEVNDGPSQDKTNSILPSDCVPEKTDWSAPSQLSTPSVINQFQSPAVDITSQSDTSVAQTMPSCSSSNKEDGLPETSSRTSHATETSSQAPHIPHR